MVIAGGLKTTAAFEVTVILIGSVKGTQACWHWKARDAV